IVERSAGRRDRLSAGRVAPDAARAMGSDARPRRALRAAAAALAVAVVPLAWAGADAKQLSRLRPIVTGLDEPVYVTGTATEPGRLYVVEQPGRILVVENGKVLAEPFLDIRDQ